VAFRGKLTAQQQDAVDDLVDRAADRGFSPGSIIEFPQVAPGWGAAGAA
jgi:hypothetical protein